MPTLTQLSVAIRSQLKASGRPDLPGSNTAVSTDFERWLSYLVDTPPWLDEGQKLRNRAAFSDVAGALHEILSALQIRVVSDDAPPWLMRLVGYWDQTCATVLTFNYDVLVELAWLTIVERRSWSDLYTVPITPAALRTVGIIGGEEPPEGLRLLKLHGSLTWWYSGAGSPPGDVVYDTGLAGPWTIEGAGSRWDNGLKFVKDKYPLIVPPAAIKSPYYGNQILRALWLQAAEALRSTDEVVLLGLGLPVSDLLIATLLATELPVDATVVPVNLDGSIVDRLNVVLGATDNRVISAFAGIADPIEKWIRSHGID